MTLQQALENWVEGRDISREAMRAVMTTVMTGEASQAQIGALLVALRMKGEAIDEIAGAAEVMRELVTPVDVSGDHVIDLVGTGGDGANLFNVSTAATFVAAAAGAQVAKHGNRSVSSSSGSSDVLETLGVNLDVSPEQIAACVQEVGLCFMWATGCNLRFKLNLLHLKLKQSHHKTNTPLDLKTFLMQAFNEYT